jgi:dipeptide/tripeptide permease
MDMAMAKGVAMVIGPIALTVIARPVSGETQAVAIVITTGITSKNAASLLTAMMPEQDALMDVARAARALETLFGAIDCGIVIRTPFGAIATDALSVALL